MISGNGRVFRALAGEALADAMRRRVVPAIGVLALLSLLFVDSCTSCQPTITAEGQEIQIGQIAGYGGLLVTVVLGLWTLVLAGVLASDHLAETLADGSAHLTLARPVSRETFALARLGGALVLAWATGALLLGVTGALLAARQGLAIGPLLAAAAACAVGAVTVGALAMAASLALPRAVTALVVVGGVWGLGSLEAAAQFGVELQGLTLALVRAGPPLAGSMIVALGDWIEPTAARGNALELAVRSLAWAGASAALLVVCFRRIELKA